MKNKELEKKQVSRETRVFRTRFETRSKEEGGNSTDVVTGYAVLFDNETDMHYFREIVVPGAFDDVLDDDVKVLFNHDPNQLLARTESGTLRIKPDKKGLYYEFDPPDTSLGRDLVVLIRRGDLNQSSYGFNVGEERWEDLDSDKPLRIITKFSRLFDVAPATFPANTDTSVVQRSLRIATKNNKKPMEEHFLRMIRLMDRM